MWNLFFIIIFSIAHSKNRFSALASVVLHKKIPTFYSGSHILPLFLTLEQLAITLVTLMLVCIEF